MILKNIIKVFNPIPKLIKKNYFFQKIFENSLPGELYLNNLKNINYFANSLIKISSKIS